MHMTFDEKGSEPQRRSDPGKIKHPVLTAIGVLIMIAVIVVGIVLWRKGSAEAVYTSGPSLGEPVAVESNRAGVTATPVEAVASNNGPEALRVSEIRLDVVRTVPLAPCFSAMTDMAMIDARYTVPLPDDAAQTATAPFAALVPAGSSTRVTFTVGPAQQPSGTVVVTAFRGVLVADDGAQLGLPSATIAATPELASWYVREMTALDPAARAAQHSCAQRGLAELDSLLGVTAMHAESIRDLRDAYAALAQP